MNEKWSEEDSNDFIEYGDFFIPDRFTQINIITEVLSKVPSLNKIIDLGCGEGKLCKAILEKFGKVKVSGLDLSPEMLSKAKENLKTYRDRITLTQFNLADESWRNSLSHVNAVVSSLVIHHLDADQKQKLFQDLFQILDPGGVFVFADIMLPAHEAGFKIASSLWDSSVKASSHDGKAYSEFKNNRWNYFEYPDDDPIDKPSTLADQITWMKNAGFSQVDVYWMNAGHAILGGWKTNF